MRLTESLSQAFRSGACILTSSARAARALRRLYAETQQDLGLTAWETPDILDWESWLERLWLARLRTGAETRTLLSPVQEHEIWVRLVKPAIEGLRLISADGVADLAQGAYALLCAYDARAFVREDMISSDIDSFCAWARSFEKQCRQEEWISRGLLPLVLAEAVSHPEAARLLDLPAQLIPIGFSRLRPAEQRLISALEQAGCEVKELSEEKQAQDSLLIEAADARDEIATCACWARQAIRAAAEEKRRLHVAVIVPDLHSMRSEVERIFREVLAPEAVPIAEEEFPVPFEFSLGVPLSEVPSARAALLLLRWMNEPLSEHELSWLLLSGFLWRQQTDLLPLAELDAKIRREGVLPPEYPLNDYLRQRGWGRNEASASLRDRLDAARKAWRENRGEKLSFSQWSARARRILAAAGWPGPHRLESEDFQALRRWEQLLDSVATLSFDGTRVSYEEFLGVLTRHGTETIFSAQSQHPAIEVLGPFEAAGMRFDAIWFLRADDARWPAQGRPHPFLSKDLQRERGMPHADAAADWELAGSITSGLERSAPQCIFSYAVNDDDGERRASTVLRAELKKMPAASLRRKVGAPRAGLKSGREFPLPRTEVEDAMVVPWPKEREAGGVTTLRMQAACPFQAFATKRLEARELDQQDWGLDPAERGNLLHRALEGVWGELKDRATLIDAKVQGQLRRIVETHVDLALGKYRRNGPAGEERAGRLGLAAKDIEEGPESEAGQEHEEHWSDAYLRAERHRVVHLIEDWLSLEERRTPFHVAKREEKLSAAVGDLKLKVRADRIDEVEGGHLIIDYKTGNISAGSWEGARPEEPQLPLYAAFGEVDSLKGVLLARVRSSKQSFEGCVEDPEATLFAHKTKLSQYSDELRLEWRETLTALGEGFLRGEAQVDPKRYPKTCEFCALRSLCRVAEKRLIEIEAGRDTAEDESDGD